FVLPAPAPGSVNIFAWLLIHCFHSRCIFSSGSFLFSGGVFFQSSITEAGARYRTRNFFIGDSFKVIACRLFDGSCRQVWAVTTSQWSCWCCILSKGGRAHTIPGDR